MNKIKIKNGFNLYDQNEVIITGVLLEGTVKANYHLKVNNTLIPINRVEFDRTTNLGTTHVRLMISNSYKVRWYDHYNKEYEVVFDLLSD